MNKKKAVEIAIIIKLLKENGRYLRTKDYIQHGDMSVYEHCFRVTYMSMALADKLHIDIDRKSLIRGALLHDYFLYDWHDKDKTHSIHGFHHPATALKRAKEDYELNYIEKNIILRHMFPLTLVPPMCKEAWLVCIADKICATRETFKPVMKKIRS